MKKVLGLVLTFVLSLTVISSVGAEAVDNSTIQTPEDYISYLESKELVQSLDLNRNNGEATEASSFIEKFKNLPREKQEKFVEYISGPELLEGIVTADTPEKEQALIEKYNGDLSIGSELVADESFNASEFILSNSLSSVGLSPLAVGDSWPYTFHEEKPYTIFGLDFIKTGIYLQIQVKTVAANTSQVIAVNYAYGALLQNWYPGANLTVNNAINPYISDDKYRATKIVTWQWNFLWKGLGATLGTIEQTITGDKTGHGTYSERNL